VNTTRLPHRAAELLAAHAGTLADRHALIGLDGFVDSIIRVVDKRDSKEEFSVVPTIAAFAERIGRAIGKSTNMELWVERVKLGGNGPIMANALAVAGPRVTYVGNIGFPQLHPAFEEFGKRATIYSVAEAATTDALEFDDGKIMFGKRRPLHDITWETLVQRIGREELIRLLTGSHLIGLQNWTMIPHMSNIWQHILDDACPKLPAGARHTFFFDLADPESREADDIRDALQLISKFQKHFNTYLGLNEKESFEIGEVLGYHGASDGEAAVIEVARFIHDKLKIAGVVVHPRAYAVAASAAGVPKVAGPFVEKPLISTGAGDHFNAGFCLGKLIGADDEAALQIGVGTSGYYVRTAKSPTAGELAEFLRSL
jgi:sugar/nucleoside kinase (ribokinase family)